MSETLATKPSLALPLFDGLTSYRLDPEKSQLELELVFDPESHRYLKSHLFDGNPLVPGPVLHELLAEAALELATQRAPSAPHFVGSENFKIERGVPIGFGKSVLLRVRAQWRGLNATHEGWNAEAYVEVTSDALAPDGRVLRKNRRHAFGTVQLAHAPRKSANLPIALPSHAEHYQMPGEMYSHALFFSHGPELQSLTGDFSLYDDNAKILGAFETSGKERDWMASGNQAFACSPLALDTAFQLEVLLVCITRKRGRLPVGATRLSFYRNPRADELCYGLVQRHHEDDLITDARLTLVDKQGNMLVDIESFRLQAHAAWPIDVAGDGAMRRAAFRVDNPIYGKLCA